MAFLLASDEFGISIISPQNDYYTYYDRGAQHVLMDITDEKRGIRLQQQLVIVLLAP